MRARLIKPGYFDDADLAKLPFGARLLFAGLWCMADREGRLIDAPKKIAGDVFPHDTNIDANQVDEWLDMLSVKQIVRYEVSGDNYIEIKNFKKHQSVNIKERPSIIKGPSCLLSVKSTCSAREKHMLGTGKDNAEHVKSTLSPEAEAEADVCAHSAHVNPYPELGHGDVDAEEIARQMYERHPAHRRGSLKLVMDAITAVAVDAVNPDGIVVKLDRCHRAACKSRDWTKQEGEFAPGLAKWIRSTEWEGFEDAPADKPSQYRPVSEILKSIRGEA